MRIDEAVNPKLAGYGPASFGCLFCNFKPGSNKSLNCRRAAGISAHASDAEPERLRTDRARSQHFIGGRNAFLPKVKYNGGRRRATILEVSNLGCVRGDRRLFRGLDFSASPGTFVQLTGPNGSGKTSLLRILCGLLAPAEGQIKWDGANIRSLGEEYFTSVTFLGHRHGVKDELSAIENLRISNALNGIVISKERALAVLEKMGLAGRESLPARLLSEGQRRRVALARLLVCETKLWLLDEVMTSLDKSAVSLVRSLIEKHLSDGGIAIVATHQELGLSTALSKRLELTT